MRPLGGVVALGIGALLVVAGCGADGASSGSSSAPAPASSSADPDAPLIDEDFPDPDVVATDDGWRAFATGMNGLNIRTATTPDLRSWTVERRDVLPTLPAWASTGRTWAPDVSQRADGTWVMYVTALHTDSGRQCIGVATSPTADGTFTPADDEPLVCPVDEGGAIDASTFTDDDGTRYLLWKTDGNCCGLDTWIEIAPLSQDGLALAGEPTRLLHQDQPWEGDLVEAPTLVRHDDAYVLLYSANAYGGDAYAVGAARASDLLGPYTKQPDPLLASHGDLRGPGGQDVVATDDGDVLVVHGWDELYTYRALHSVPLRWDDDGTVSTDP
ncbi:glycoside hydrolase family 43 protein [Cellulomonas massiliensis]|uniref:glycoside hydrolase family 43 protein n=1 Tax=Cellulomonas massiliensis TaxID=1465811 RepID=UPI0002E3DC44|nr:glycoside hydrolase family 43 protein [Cellulomonas massiliensis]